MDVPRSPVDGHHVVAVGDGIDNRTLGVELLALLVVVRREHVRAVLHRSDVRRLGAQQQTQERRLSGAVRPDEPHAIAPHHSYREAADDDVVAERLAHVLRLEHELSGPFDLFRAQADRSRLRPSGRAFLTHRHQRANTPFVARPPSLDALPQPCFFFSQPLVELFIPNGFVRERLLALAQKRPVVARPGRQRASIELDDARGEPFEKHTIVGDEQDRSRIAVDERLEPGHRVDVEMVCRFVEHEQPRLVHQRAPEQHAPAPSPGEGVDGDVGFQIEAGQDEAHALLAAPVFLVRVGAFSDDIEHSSRIGQRHVLREPSDAQRRLPPDGAVIRGEVAADDLEQRGFAGAVAADDGDALFVVDLQAHLRQQRKVAERHRDAVECHQRHGSAYGVAWRRIASRNSSPRSSAFRAPTPLTSSRPSIDVGRSRAISRSVASWKMTYGGTPALARDLETDGAQPLEQIAVDVLPRLGLDAGRRTRFVLARGPLTRERQIRVARARP